MDDLEICCSLENIRVIFILFGDVCSIREIVVEFIQRNTEADGIISTKSALIKKGRELELFTILRYFLLDSMAYENIRQQQHTVKPDFIEVLPGVMPKVIEKVCKLSGTGYLIAQRE